MQITSVLARRLGVRFDLYSNHRCCGTLSYHHIAPQPTHKCKMLSSNLRLHMGSGRFLKFALDFYISAAHRSRKCNAGMHISIVYININLFFKLNKELQLIDCKVSNEYLIIAQIPFS